MVRAGACCYIWAPMRLSSRRQLAVFGIGALVLLTGSGGSCSEERHPPTTPDVGPVREADLPAPDLRLVVLTDLDGYLEPCGCTSRPLGGIDRLSARVSALREDGVPTLVVSAGDLFFHGAPHGGDLERAREQERLRAETLVEILRRIGLDAAAPGPLDFSFGADAFTPLARAASFPLLAAGAQVTTPEGEPPVLAPTTIRRIGDRTIGLLGLSELEVDGALPAGVELQSPLRDAGREAVRSLRAGGADLVVALVSGDRRVARQVATGIDGIDFVIHGGLDEAEVSPPSTSGGGVVVSAGRQGQGLVVLELRSRPHGDGWADASVWTREALRTHVESQITSLRARIGEWEADRSAAAADIQRQRDRVTRLEREVRELSAPPTVTGNAFTARYEELAPEAPRDPAITALMTGLDERVNEHNRDAFREWAPEPPAEGQPHYVGSQACAACHGAAVQWWRSTPHGHAYATLEERHKNFNLSCVGCHVTGYLRRGGSTVTHLENLEDVGCENCHGPASEHVRDPENATVDVHRDADQNVCLGCHTPEHSDHFHYPAYRAMLIAPGHGG